MKKILNAFYHSVIKRYSWVPILLFIIILIIINMIQGDTDLPFFKTADESLFTKLIDPLIGISTFIIAVYLSLVAGYSSWTASLDKKLTIVYIYRAVEDNDSMQKGQDYATMICYEVPLGGTSDIRALSQQIGRQMNGEKNLSMLPYSHFGSAEVVFSETTATFIQHYICGIFLKEIPSEISSLKYLDQNDIYTDLNENTGFPWREVNLNYHLKNYDNVLRLKATLKY